MLQIPNILFIYSLTTAVLNTHRFLFETKEDRDTNQKAFLLAEAEAFIARQNEQHPDSPRPLTDAVELRDKWLLRYEDYSSSRHKETSKQNESKKQRRAEEKAVAFMTPHPHREVHSTLRFDPSSSCSSSSPSSASSPVLGHKGKRPRDEEESDSERILRLEAEVQKLGTQLMNINRHTNAEVNELKKQVETFRTKSENFAIAAEKLTWRDDVVAHKKKSKYNNKTFIEVKLY